ncbi:MltA domain-containing protein, partial [Escherichia coli]|uniref:MltA domain-containing protein n=1 Tax=Escherichia coli TaxID=562 RepID=UPI001E5FE95A
SASSKINPMNFHLLRHAAMALIVGTLVACTTTTKPVYDPSPVPDLQPGGSPAVTPRPPLVTNTPTKSRWIAADWSELPGLQEDALHEAWNAWLKNCERPSSVFAGLCRDVRQLSIATGDEQRAWLMANLQPYRIEALGGGPDGMLTAYYEPLFEARRLPGDG